MVGASIEHLDLAGGLPWVSFVSRWSLRRDRFPGVSPVLERVGGGAVKGCGGPRLSSGLG